MKSRILVIDDELAILDALGIFLRHEGYRVETVTEYANYFEKTAPKDMPDLIILDILLMEEDGRQIAKDLKQNPTTKHIPIIMISAHPSAGKSALKAGADVFLAKPFDSDELKDVVRKCLTPGAKRQVKSKS